MQDRLVSIITPSYRSQKFIAQTIESVLAQSYQEWEMIIVDDCSPDNANEIISSYIQQDPRIKLIKLEKNSGAAAARNEAIKEAKGRYIAFLDADDLWMEDKLKKQIAFMQKKGALLCYSAYNVIDESENDMGCFVPKDELSYKDLLKTNQIGCLTAIYDAKELGKLYMPLIKKRQDYALWLKILKKIDYAYGLKEPLATYRVLNRSLSSNKVNAALYQWRIYTEIEKLGILKSLYYFSYYAFYGIKKYKN
ncbi:Putative N-acetylgalactosaminyl-diphosphoundecaprenol glucuronosyltransferase [hydrothermal vent metagenome]|uniref:Putative N-acetylgalactosaminyl-diphosphoundecaprenol glucuronosyltransferase n=1 Tax=hydrothermal vent metagenome TaxID=652676 RepID=A0A1W1BNA7_9ZZZZ